MSEPKPKVEIPDASFEGDVDYAKIHEALLEEFNTAYEKSQTLVVTEKTQRQALYYYQRRNQALLDLLAEFDEDDSWLDEDEDAFWKRSSERVEKIVEQDPLLQPSLQPVMDIASRTRDSIIFLKRTARLDLAVAEMVPELHYDELDPVETNPQDIEMWTRRNYSHLVTSKFRPFEIKARGVRDYLDQAGVNNRKRKRKD